MLLKELIHHWAYSRKWPSSSFPQRDDPELQRPLESRFKSGAGALPSSGLGSAISRRPMQYRNPNGRMMTMITQYVTRALERAKYRLIDDGTFAATVPGLRGVVATGDTLEACRRQLAEVVEEWVLVRVARGLPVPTLAGAAVRVRRAS
jgi:predicted RNase H-like HicB family nuclease